MTAHLSLLVPVVWAAVCGRYLEMAVLGGALISHELAHFLVIEGFGLSVSQVLVLPIGARMRVVGLSGRPELEVPIALAGPLNNFLLLGLGLLVRPVIGAGGRTWDFFLACNLALALFNLIPSLPLDGGRLLRAYLAESVGMAEATRLVADWGHYWGLGFMGVFAYFAIAGGMYLWVLLAVGVLLVLTARRERMEVSLVPFGNLYRRKAQAKKRDSPPPVEHLSAYESEKVARVARRLGSRGWAIIWVLNSDFELLGSVTEAQLREAVSRGKGEKPIGILLDEKR